MKAYCLDKIFILFAVIEKMKAWKNKYPIMRNAKQAMFMRQELIRYLITHPYLSYSRTQKALHAIEMYNNFINKRSISKDKFLEIHNRYADYACINEQELIIAGLSHEFNLSERSIKYLLKQSIK